MRFLRNMIPLFLVAAILVAGCNKQDSKKPEDKESGHVAHHGGCLNAMTTCAVGHAEVKVDGDVLKCWFVGGENETGKAIRVPATQIDLEVTLDGGEKKAVTLKATPLVEAQEKVGDCSYFEGRADWLKGVKKFDALSSEKVMFQGEKRDVKIEYPKGFDPD